MTNQNTALWGAVRSVVAVGLGYLAGKGMIPADVSGELAAALATLGVAFWSVFAKKQA